MKRIIEKSLSGKDLTKEEIIKLISGDCAEELFGAADYVRKENVGDEIHLRGLIEFSNFCSKNCLYCGIRRDNRNVKRFRLSEEKIIELARSAVMEGYKTIVLQSGEDPYFTTKRLASLIKEIKKTDVALTLSIGERPREDYEILKNSGADRFLLRIETSNPNFYKKFHPDSDYFNRVNCLKNLKELGFELGTGVIVGLPGQTDEMLAEDILFFKEIGADMVGLGPLIVSEETPLKGEGNGDLTRALKIMAIVRLVLKDVNIPATTAMEALHPKGRIMALQAGANVIMPNVGSFEKELYKIYPGKANAGTSSRAAAEEIIESIGRKVSKGFGFRKI